MRMTAGHNKRHLLTLELCQVSICGDDSMTSYATAEDWADVVVQVTNQLTTVRSTWTMSPC